MVPIVVVVVVMVVVCGDSERCIMEYHSLILDTEHTTRYSLCKTYRQHGLFPGV